MRSRASAEHLRWRKLSGRVFELGAKQFTPVRIRAEDNSLSERAVFGGIQL